MVCCQGRGTSSLYQHWLSEASCKGRSKIHNNLNRNWTVQEELSAFAPLPSLLPLNSRKMVPKGTLTSKKILRNVSEWCYTTRCWTTLLDGELSDIGKGLLAELLGIQSSVVVFEMECCKSAPPKLLGQFCYCSAFTVTENNMTGSLCVNKWYFSSLTSGGVELPWLSLSEGSVQSMIAVSFFCNT